VEIQTSFFQRDFPVYTVNYLADNFSGTFAITSSNFLVN